VNIQPIGFVDTWAFGSTLFARYKDRFAGEHHSMSLLPLRSVDGPLPILNEWKSAKALLARLRVAAAPFFGVTPELGEAALVQVRAGGFIEWGMRESDWCSFHLPIVPSPGAWMYSGGDGAVLPIGQLTFVNRGVLHSAVNLGQHPVIHLVADARKTDDPLGAD
jgi:hypothetical protein